MSRRLDRLQPLTGAWAIGVLVGIRLVFAGWSILAIGGAGRAVAEVAASAEAGA